MLFDTRRDSIIVWSVIRVIRMFWVHYGSRPQLWKRLATLVDRDPAPGSQITDHGSRQSFGVVRFYIVVTGNLVSMIQRSFKVELKPVFRKGCARPVYRIRVPDEITNAKTFGRPSASDSGYWTPPSKGRSYLRRILRSKFPRKPFSYRWSLASSFGWGNAWEWSIFPFSS